MNNSSNYFRKINCFQYKNNPCKFQHQYSKSQNQNSIKLTIRKTNKFFERGSQNPSKTNRPRSEKPITQPRFLINTVSILPARVRDNWPRWFHRGRLRLAVLYRPVSAEQFVVCQPGPFSIPQPCYPSYLKLRLCQIPTPASADSRHATTVREVEKGVEEKKEFWFRKSRHVRCRAPSLVFSDCFLNRHARIENRDSWG